MTEYTCYTCGTPIAVDMREAYMVIGYGDYVVECDDPEGHLVINIDNNNEMAV